MKIAIIEDNNADRDILVQKVEKYMKRRGASFECVPFDDAETFLQKITPGEYQIVFMDIYLKQMNGMDAAQALCRMDKKCRIVFTTVSEEHLHLGYSVRATHYLMKPIEHAAFLQAMEFCEIVPEYEVPSLCVTISGTVAQINTEKILFVEYRGRRTHIQLQGREMVVNGTFREVTAPLLCDRRFVLCIRGLVVNMQHIDRQEGNAFVLENGHCLPINIRGKKAVMDTYRRFVFEEMEGFE